MKNNCCVCYNDTKDKLICNHVCCKKCFYKIENNLCPLCRNETSIYDKNNYDNNPKYIHVYIDDKIKYIKSNKLIKYVFQKQFLNCLNFKLSHFHIKIERIYEDKFDKFFVYGKYGYMGFKLMYDKNEIVSHNILMNYFFNYKYHYSHIIDIIIKIHTNKILTNLEKFLLNNCMFHKLEIDKPYNNNCFIALYRTIEISNFKLNI